jgi:hypothetical protein
MKMKNFLMVLAVSTVSLSAAAQSRYMTREGKISFYSDAPLEKIEAHNAKAAGVFETAGGNFQAIVLMKAFMFEKDLMQQHFNENYVESDKYPKATFKGVIENLSEVDFQKDGEYAVTVNGKLELHGVTREVKAQGKLKVEGTAVTATSEFFLKPEDYDIKIPKLVRDKIAKEVKVMVDMKMNQITGDKTEKQ